MGRAENRSEDYRVWKNRLNDIFNRYNVEDKEDFKDSRTSKQLKNGVYIKEEIDKSAEKPSRKTERQQAKSEIKRQVVDMSEQPTQKVITTRQQLEEINQLIERYNDFILQLEEKKYELEKEIAYDEWYNS
jgi:predicted RNase H-like nuclease (RuvC/YqgF family)